MLAFAHFTRVTRVAVIPGDSPTTPPQVRSLYANRTWGIVVITSVAMSRATRSLPGILAHVQVVHECERLRSAWFGTADEEAICLSGTDLAALGHRRLANIGQELTLSIGAKRLQSVRRALDERGGSWTKR